MAQELIDDKSTLPDGTKPLPEPMLTKIYGAIWHH